MLRVPNGQIQGSQSMLSQFDVSDM